MLLTLLSKPQRLIRVILILGILVSILLYSTERSSKVVLKQQVEVLQASRDADAILLTASKTAQRQLEERAQELEQAYEELSNEARDYLNMDVPDDINQLFRD